MIDIVHHHVIPAAFALLPAVMRSERATAMLLAIGLQESRFLARRQFVGPARGFWQFERAGVEGVLAHHASREYARAALRQLRYEHHGRQPSEVHAALEHNDVLAAVFARLLLWTLPDPLAHRGDEFGAWSHYLAAWRPGKPRPETWGTFFNEAHDRVSVWLEHQARRA